MASGFIDASKVDVESETWPYWDAGAIDQATSPSRASASRER